MVVPVKAPISDGAPLVVTPLETSELLGQEGPKGGNVLRATRQDAAPLLPVCV